jgi:hypothetical protein
MPRTSRSLVAVGAAVFGGLLAVTASFAQTSSPSPQPPAAAHGTMGDGGMMNMMGAMSPEHMAAMGRMIENCNRMMEQATTPAQPRDGQPG